MLPLSVLIDKQECGDSETEVLDELLSFGKYLVVPDITQAPLRLMVEWERAVTEFKKMSGFRLPAPSTVNLLKNIFGAELYNDLYSPGLYAEDGVYHVFFPVLGGPRSVEGVTTDFALLLLTAFVVPNPETQTIVMEAWWPDGRVVRGVPSPEVWKAVGHLVKAAQLKDRKRITGPACHRCLRQKDCKSWNALDEVLSLAPPDKSKAKTEAHRLWLEWILLKDLDKKAETRKKFVEGRLLELAVDGSIDVNGMLKLNVSTQERSSYEVDPVYAVLQPAGLWEGKFGAIRVGELHKALPTFPPAVRAQLGRLEKKEKVAPSLREAAAGTERSVFDVQTSPFVGLHLRS